jgi:hypothetical protein
LLEKYEYKKLDPDCLDQAFITLSDPILACLAINELSDIAWIVWTGFFAFCSIGTVVTKFPSLLAVLVFLHSSERHQCRRRLMSNIKKWSVYHSSSSHMLSPELQEQSDLVQFTTYRLELKRVMRIFNSEFHVSE